MSEMVPTGSKYTDVERREAAVQYAIKGSLSAIERDMGIPDSTVHNWLQTEWFNDIVEEVRSEIQDQHIARYHELTSESLDLALAGVRRLDPETLKAVDIKALVVTGATATDKARLLLNQPTSIRGDSDSVKELAAQFAKLSADHKRISTDHDNIQGSVVDNNDE